VQALCEQALLLVWLGTHPRLLEPRIIFFKYTWREVLLSVCCTSIERSTFSNIVVWLRETSVAPGRRNNFSGTEKKTSEYLYVSGLYKADFAWAVQISIVEWPSRGIWLYPYCLESCCRLICHFQCEWHLPENRKLDRTANQPNEFLPMPCMIEYMGIILVKVPAILSDSWGQ
jgi:hypothetical protein